uniref:Peptidase M20 dimerisation domain-containing protein n=1 Tax=Neobodo designis TaxID=312471 RepID=A0A7S1R526_NEODS
MAAKCDAPAETWARINDFVGGKWDAEVVPTLSEYIKVPNLSPMFDPDFATNGLQEKAFALLIDWLKQQPVKGMKYELLEEQGKPPFLCIEIDGTVPTAKTLLMYGHMDKQPPLRPWAEGLDPYEPVIRDGKLYGRAGADDGYAIFASVLSVMALQREGIPHSRVCIIIEADEESGSSSLKGWIEKTKDRLGDVDLVITLDSGSCSYDQLWVTTSLRGVAIVSVECSTLYEGMHSGIAGGVVPDTTRILRHQLDNVEDSRTGDIKVAECHCEIPAAIREGGYASLEKLGFDAFLAQFPFQQGVKAENTTSVADLAIRNFWKPSLTIVGVDGLPSVADGGNVLRQLTRFKLSIRLPPNVDGAVAAKAVAAALERDPPNGVTVKATVMGFANGWASPPISPWLMESLNTGSQQVFQKPAALLGLAGTIPFLGMLGEMFPQAQFVISGVLGPQSNAHGPNEFLHIGFGKGVNGCMARVVADHFVQQPESAKK